MKSLHLTMMIFLQVLLASAVLYLTTFTLASPLADLHQHQHPQEPVQVAKVEQPVKSVPVSAAAPSPVAAPSEISGKSSVVPQAAAEPIQQQVPVLSKPEKVAVVESTVTEKKDVQPAPVEPKKPEVQAELTEKKHVQPPAAAPVAVVHPEPASKPVVPAEPVAVVVAKSEQQPSAVQVPQPAALVAEAPIPAPTPVAAPARVPAAVEAPVSAKKTEDVVKARSEPEAAFKPSVVVKEDPAVVHAIKKESVEKSSVVKADDQLEKRGDAPAKPVVDSVAQPPVVVAAGPIAPVASAVQVAPVAPAESKVHSNSPTYSAATPAVVKGGLGPLHLLATTLCSYQPDKLVADDSLNQLYSRRAVLRKSLFEFMSLKFTNLEKLSSRLGSGLQVVPVKSVAMDPADPVHSRGAPSAGVAPSHGWPVVGKCTAHDLKLMGEAAWCENEQPPAKEPQQQSAASNAVAEEAPAKITSNKHISRVEAARSIVDQPTAAGFLPSPEQSSVISKLLHVSDIKDAPLVESSIYNLNLTQQQLATLEAHATSTRECRRNALRYTKALFNHLAEDQKSTSDTWPKLYALISADDCARKRMIDIITALSGFRTDVTSIRRDNLEFAFAMDDLRTKVLENEINVALTFDKQFIEVEQFLQQSVQLMLSNIDPNKAKITSMRYRSLMYGSPNSDDQCIDIHQRLLAQSYPTDCNPTQFGQLPDVLRMTASSLELWSIEKEISLHISRVVDYPNSNPAGQQKVKEDVNECIANLVSS